MTCEIIFLTFSLDVQNSVDATTKMCIRDRPSATHSQNFICSSSTYALKHSKSKASIALMLGLLSLRRSLPTTSSPSPMTSYRRNASEPSSRFQSWQPFMRKYGSREQEKANDVYLAGVEDVLLFSSQGYIIGNRRKKERKSKSSVTKSFEKR